MTKKELIQELFNSEADDDAEVLLTTESGQAEEITKIEVFTDDEFTEDKQIIFLTNF